ncbi:MAG: cytochrome c3 family protein [Nitrospiria bacterium]
MKKVSLFLILTLLTFSLSCFGEETLPFFEEILTTSHNIVPKGSAPPSSHQVCSVCHTVDEVNGYLGASKTPEELVPILDSPNPPAAGVSKALWVSTEMKEGYLPTYSRLIKEDPSSNCLVCHDGVIGDDIHGRKQDSGKFLDHPVDIPYPRESTGHFVPLLPLPNELRYWSIPDLTEKGITLPTGPTSSYFSTQTHPLLLVRTSFGKVGCGSCHNPHSSKIPAYLRESPSSLCLVCHIR